MKTPDRCRSGTPPSAENGLRGLYFGVWCYRRPTIGASPATFHTVSLRDSLNRPFGFASHGDDDFSSSVSLFQIADRLGDLAQRVRPVDDRCDLAGFDELLEDDHVLVVLLVNECAQLLSHERGQHERADLAIGTSEPPSSPFASNDDEGPPGGEGAPQACQRGVPADVEDQVVALIALCEVLARVVDYVIRTDGSDHLHLLGAANACYVRAERFGYLHGVGPHSSRGTDDQHFLPRAHLSVIAQGLQGGRAHDGYHSRLLKGEVYRLGRELVLLSTHVLGVGALSDAEYLIARTEPAHVLADPPHDPGHVRADDGVLGRAEAVASEAYRVGQTRHDVPDVPTHAGRMHAHQYLIVSDLGDADVPEFQDIGGAVGVPDHCLHRVLLLSPLEWLHLMYQHREERCILQNGWFLKVWRPSPDAKRRGGVRIASSASLGN